MKRQKLIQLLVRLIKAVRLPHPVRVAIDGVDGAGKTTLANELMGPITTAGRPVIRASIDGFHNPRKKRYRRGELSPFGYYHDSFDYDALKAALLHPLGPKGNLRYRRAVFDYRIDAPAEAPLCRAEADAILLFDGIFLQRPELCDCWDFCIFVAVEFANSTARAIQRDSPGDADPQSIIRRYRKRYIAGQKLYLSSCKPTAAAHAVVFNDDLANPRIVLHAELNGSAGASDSVGNA